MMNAIEKVLVKPQSQAQTSQGEGDGHLRPTMLRADDPEKDVFVFQSSAPRPWTSSCEVGTEAILPKPPPRSLQTENRRKRARPVDAQGGESAHGRLSKLPSPSLVGPFRNPWELRQPSVEALETPNETETLPWGAFGAFVQDHSNTWPEHFYFDRDTWQRVMGPDSLADSLNHGSSSSSTQGYQHPFADGWSNFIPFEERLIPAPSTKRKRYRRPQTTQSQRDENFTFLRRYASFFAIELSAESLEKLEATHVGKAVLVALIETCALPGFDRLDSDIFVDALLRPGGEKRIKVLHACGLNLFCRGWLASEVMAMTQMPAGVAAMEVLAQVEADKEVETLRPKEAVKRILRVTAPARNIASVRQHENFLRYKGFSAGQILRVAANNSGWRGMQALVRCCDYLLFHGFSHADLIAIAGHHGSSQVFDDLVEYLNRLRSMGFSLRDLVRVASHGGAKGNLSAVLTYGAGLLAQNISHEYIVKVASRGGALRRLAFMAQLVGCYGFVFSKTDFDAIANIDLSRLDEIETMLCAGQYVNLQYFRKLRRPMKTKDEPDEAN